MLESSKNRTTTLCMGYRRWNYIPKFEENALGFPLWYDISLNCSWLATRWQQFSTHLHTNNTQNDTKQTIHRTTQKLEECGLCPVFAGFTLAFALQLRKKHGKTSVRIAEECQLAQANSWTVNQRTVRRRVHRSLSLVSIISQANSVFLPYFEAILLPCNPHKSPNWSLSFGLPD
jgi:hypothetical protein